MSERDPLENLFRSKLENFPIEYKSAYWTEFESKLANAEKEEKKKRGFLFWLIPAILFLGSIAIYFGYQSGNKLDTVEILSIKTNVVTPISSAEVLAEKNVSSEKEETVSNSNALAMSSKQNASSKQNSLVVTLNSKEMTANTSQNVNGQINSNVVAKSNSNDLKSAQKTEIAMNQSALNSAENIVIFPPSSYTIDKNDLVYKESNSILNQPYQTESNSISKLENFKGLYSLELNEIERKTLNKSLSEWEKEKNKQKIQNKNGLSVQIGLNAFNNAKKLTNDKESMHFVDPQLSLRWNRVVHKQVEIGAGIGFSQRATSQLNHSYIAKDYSFGFNEVKVTDQVKSAYYIYLPISVNYYLGSGLKVYSSLNNQILTASKREVTSTETSSFSNSNSTMNKVYSPFSDLKSYQSSISFGLSKNIIGDFRTGIEMQQDLNKLNFGGANSSYNRTFKLQLIYDIKRF